MERTILGLDIGTSSIGWAVVQTDTAGNPAKCTHIGSRIIPTTADVLGKFEQGESVSETAERRMARMMRRGIFRRQLRRSRLLRVLHCLGWLPEHFDQAHCWSLDEENIVDQPHETGQSEAQALSTDVAEKGLSSKNKLGRQKDEGEVKLAWKTDASGQRTFLFRSAFDEMLEDFRRHQPEWLSDHLIPADWTLYYLREKGLTRPLSREELAWVLLSFNQKRGYQAARGEEEEENVTKQEELVETRVLSVTTPEEKRGKDTWYHLQLDCGLVYRRKSAHSLAPMEGSIIQVIVKREFEKDGITPKLDREGQPKYTITMPNSDDWKLRKKRTERDLARSGQTVGSFIYRRLLNKPDDKIRGEYVHTVDRALYRSELLAILAEQAKHHPELSDTATFRACAEELYPRNNAHREHLLTTKTLTDLLVDDVLFYQRPLRSQKGTIERCPLERGAAYVDAKGKTQYTGLKCAARSNPYYQEFRLWQWIHNLRIVDRHTDADRTDEFLPDQESRSRLYEWLRVRKSVRHEEFYKDFLKLKFKRGTLPAVAWNYVEDKAEGYPAGETYHTLSTALTKAKEGGAELPPVDEFLRAPYVCRNPKDKGPKRDKRRKAAHPEARQAAPTNEYMLWHLLYSVTDRPVLEKALHQWQLGDAFVAAMLRVKPFAEGYGAYSEKALKKLLSVMRCGSCWHEDDVCREAKMRMQQLHDGTLDAQIAERMHGVQDTLENVMDCQGLPTWQAGYLVYGCHSEERDVMRWTSPEEMEDYVRSFPHHSLRNPIVEKVLLETLRVVHDIWKTVGRIDEIHVEMGREMTRTAEQRKQMSERNADNEATNLRIRQLLQELHDNADHQMACENIRPYSPGQQDLLRIYEEGALANLSEQDKDYEWIAKITARKAQPTRSELLRYRLWLDQKYRSPYTGQSISLTKLFSAAYEIEHVIPRSRYYDDSMSNKVICEAEVNKDKDNLLGAEYIRKQGGKQVGPYTVLKYDAYAALVNETFAGNRMKRKRQNLLAEDIPNDFTARQLNNTRYITRTIVRLLSAVVREEDEREAKSRHIIVCTGGITDRLKKEWGLHDVWNTIVQPRFERMNRLTGSKEFGEIVNSDGQRHFQIRIPMALAKGFSKKRIDHRHHAMDALVVACAQLGLIQLLNNESAGNDPDTFIAQRKKWTAYKGHADWLTGEVYDHTHLRKPWPTFTEDARRALEHIVVSFKHRERLITRTRNTIEHIDETGRKVRIPQKGEAQWAVRKPLHKGTVHGHVNLRCIKPGVSLNNALKQPDRIADKALRQYVQDLVRKGFSPKALKEHFAAMNYIFEQRNVAVVDTWYWSDEKAPLSATRKPLDHEFTMKDIDKITDSGIRKILKNYLAAKGGDPKVAFSPEGIAELNSNIALYNDGRPHQPIKRVRKFEARGNKFQVGQRGNRPTKWVEAEQGTNLFFAIYSTANGRSYETIPLNIAVERSKQGFTPVPERNDQGDMLLFALSPGDLVYVPNDEELEKAHVQTGELRNEGIYKFVSSSDIKPMFVPHNISGVILKSSQNLIINKIKDELGLGSPQSKSGYTLEGLPIKSVCWKLEVDRLGRITRIIR